MKYCDHHGGGSEDVIQTFASPFELGEYLRAKLYPFSVDVNFGNLTASKYTEDGDPARQWKELWICPSKGMEFAVGPTVGFWGRNEDSHNL